MLSISDKNNFFEKKAMEAMKNIDRQFFVPLEWVNCAYEVKLIF
jgi:protein-L-isoaspartate O-methyltransferase